MPSSCHPEIVPAMVSIKEAIELQYEEEKQVLIPHTLIVNHEGQKYLKLRPTSQPIICFLHGEQTKRNASLSQLEPLQQLIEARNQEIKKVQHEDPDEHGDNNLFDRKEGEPPAKKRNVFAPCVVTTTVGDKPMDGLAFGKRPTRSDLAVLLDPAHLDPVVCHLRPSIATALDLPTKSYKARK